MYDRFSDVIHDYVRRGDVMLDAGCGSGRVFQYQFDDAQKPRLIVGVDVTDEPQGNRNIDAAARADLGALPFRDATFDIAISSHVAEHLTQPERVFGELSRVLKPGGRLLILTPNRWHYVTVSSALLPYSFHRRYNSWRGIDVHDIFPTVYKREHGAPLAVAVRRRGHGRRAAATSSRRSRSTWRSARRRTRWAWGSSGW